MYEMYSDRHPETRHINFIRQLDIGTPVPKVVIRNGPANTDTNGELKNENDRKKNNIWTNCRYKRFFQ